MFRHTMESMATSNYSLTPSPILNGAKPSMRPCMAALREMYGYPPWRQALPPMDELVSCILSQSTTDTNRDRAFAPLKARYPDL